MAVPPLAPPQKALQRVLRIARADSLSVMILAGLSLLLALAMLEPMGLAVSALALAAGVMEWRGCRALKRRDAETGMKLLVRAQIFLLAVILVYCVRCIASFDAGFLKDEVVPRLNEWLPALLDMSFDEFLQESGLTADDLVAMARKAFLLLYATVAVLSLLVQGGLALYYRRRIALVTVALAEPPAFPRQSPLA